MSKYIKTIKTIKLQKRDILKSLQKGSALEKFKDHLTEHELDKKACWSCLWIAQTMNSLAFKRFLDTLSKTFYSNETQSKVSATNLCLKYEEKLLLLSLVRMSFCV